MEKLNQFVDPTSLIGQGTKIWGNTQIRSEVVIGSNCIVGRNVNIGPRVSIGDHCKIQNACEINGPSKISDGVFIGPGVIFTNDHNPRAIDEHGKLKSSDKWEATTVEIHHGASIGAGAILVSPVKVGKWAMVGAGSVVTTDVADFALVLGVPAKQIGWVGKAGIRLIEQDGKFFCPKTKEQFTLVDNTLRESEAHEAN
ncbi:WbbJ Acetyltransferase (isoleucine patch superfamily) [Candidatus Nanopelagicaceae bacterium]